MMKRLTCMMGLHVPERGLAGIYRCVYCGKLIK